MSRLSSIVLSGPAVSVTLPVASAQPSDQYILTGADGLAPPELDVAIAQSVYKGGIFQGSYPKDREIVLLVGLNPSYASGAKSVAELRSAFYRLVSGSDAVTVTINIQSGPTGDYVPTTIKTTGYIRRIEAVPFVKNPQVQVTISCPGSFLQALSATNVPYTPTATSAPISFAYEGTAITGFEFDFSLTGSVASSVIVRSLPNNGTAETITIPGARVSGEKFQIKTNPSGRQVYWTNPASGSAYGDITGMCTVTADRWPAVHPGNNVIQVFNEAMTALSIITTKIRYTANYWGI